MSAFFVGLDHINAMLSAAKHLTRDGGSFPNIITNGDAIYSRHVDADGYLTQVGRQLVLENCNSLAARYPDDWRELLPDSMNAEPSKDFVFEEDVRFTLRGDLPNAAIMLCVCYDYQSCEHSGWEKSFAFRFSQWLVGKAAYQLGRGVPDCWPYDRDRTQPEIVSLSALAAKSSRR